MRATMGLPFLLSCGMRVQFVPPQLDAPRRARVSEIQEQSDGSYLVFFEGIDSIDLAEKLSGCFCLVHTDEIEQELVRYNEETLVDFAVYDHDDLLGQVVELEVLPGQSRLCVRKPDGTDLLIPWVEEMIIAIDPDEKRIDVELPAGFLDLF